MRLTLWDFRGGVDAPPGTRVVYDVEQGAAHFGQARIPGHALVWELQAGDDDPAGALLSAPVELDRASDWLLRCDRVDFPPGGTAYRHTHPGPGIRCLLHGAIRIETEGETRTYGAFEAWFEAGAEPVYAAASADEETSFVRVMLLPAEWEGRRTIHYVDAADEAKPKTQRARILLERHLEPA